MQHRLLRCDHCFRWRSDAWFDIPHWYPPLKEHTFPTSFVSLTKSVTSLACTLGLLVASTRLWSVCVSLEAHSILKHYEYHVLKQAQSAPTTAQKAAIEGLRVRLQAEIDSFQKSLKQSGASAQSQDKKKGGVVDGVFIRMSSRSPKDAPFAAERMKRELTSRLQDLKTSSVAMADEALFQNAEFNAFFTAQVNGCLCSDAVPSFSRLSTPLDRVFASHKRTASARADSTL